MKCEPGYHVALLKNIYALVKMAQSILWKSLVERIQIYKITSAAEVEKVAKNFETQFCNEKERKQNNAFMSLGPESL